MSLSHETMLQIMSLADGELEGEERARVEGLVAKDAEAARVYEALGGRGGSEVGGWLAATSESRAIAGGADAIADKVMTSIARGSRAGVSGGVAVSSIADAKAKRSLGRRAAAVVVGGLAMAAAVALYVQSGDRRRETEAPVASVAAPSEPATGVEVNEIDALSRGVSVFEIPAQAAAAMEQPGKASSVVIWVEDDPGATGAK
jgi:hypothetical protein